MKSSFPKFVFSTFAIFPLSMIATETVLDSSASFDGNKNGNFSVRESQEDAGTTYLFKGNVTLENIPGTGTAITKSCFNNTKGDLTFTGNGNSLLFQTVDAGTVAGAAVNSSVVDKSTTFIGFSSLSFIASPGSSITTGKGAVSCSTGSLSLTKMSVCSSAKTFQRIMAVLSPQKLFH
ncbi:to outer membrane protein 5 [Chlamydia pneumoniae TW-183]|uniref:To outer membrane protein 5 n=2 Tax=Chlamydia pneumoniae TaxID=83558 RepID=A0A0F7WNM9_CHLPN|nr:hypothetical protein [Chlamydia pneumoniae]AAP97950.1 to outer membrane protein 5 [Chlamydia pneumoniae TW-183]CRI32509.1 To outer membrane protein 5 [Chlamydia pneumoniae]CRI35368.1 To outer membrane protein 5 [Chlamydia pneumoniae]CRI36496.1 To outer membrane protein 5 [Chlamydia pneumoniae]CRI37620.1 To outer membrane protein 5 [Chlamydia pneumoniae]